MRRLPFYLLAFWMLLSFWRNTNDLILATGLKWSPGAGSGWYGVLESVMGEGSVYAGALFALVWSIQLVIIIVYVIALFGDPKWREWSLASHCGFLFLLILGDELFSVYRLNPELVSLHWAMFISVVVVWFLEAPPVRVNDSFND